MDTSFFIKLILSFFIGGLWIILATILADRFGSKIGGLISGLPSTVVFSLFFIAWTQSPWKATEATTIIPIIEGVDYLFILAYIFLIRKNIWLALITAFFIWFAFSFSLVFIKFNSYPLSLLGYITLLLLSYWIIEYVLKVKSVAGKTIPYTPSIILSRGFLSGFIIAFTVLVTKLGGPIWGGTFSAFPAMFTSTMLITYFSQGPLFSAATMKSSILSSITVVMYAILIRYTYLPLGIIWGTLISLAISFVFGYFIYRYIINKFN